jgi:hypothetical protein
MGGEQWHLDLRKLLRAEVDLEHRENVPQLGLRDEPGTIRVRDLEREGC